jgi:transposase
LREQGLPIICLDARHAKAALKMQINKTDSNDAYGLAQIVRTGWYREVAVKGWEAHRRRALIGARAQLVDMQRTLASHIRGTLKTFGLLIGSAFGSRFPAQVRELIGDDPTLTLIVEALLSAWEAIRGQSDGLVQGCRSCEGEADRIACSTSDARTPSAPPERARKQANFCPLCLDGWLK